MRTITDQKSEPPCPNPAKSGTTGSFNDRSVIPQAYKRHRKTLNIEDGSISLYSSDSRVWSAPFDEDYVRRGLKREGSDEPHIEKRPRTSDWPLKSADTNDEIPSVPRVALHDRYDALNVAPIPVDPLVKPRLSKFVEGSMNDRASQKPHQSYIDDSEQPRDRFEAEQNDYDYTYIRSQLNGLMHHTNRSVTQSLANDKSEVNRPASIFRFGRSVAAAFNPSSWKIWPKHQEKDTQENPVVEDRQVKAKKIYKELKRTGHLGGSAREPHLCADEKSIPINKHDSGVDIEHCPFIIDSVDFICSSTTEIRPEEKRYGRVFLDPPENTTISYNGNPYPGLAAPLRISTSQSRELTLQKGEILHHTQALRRLPSRKDLQKQQKLVKRVSDLEGKLEAARRQLAEALGEPVSAQISCSSKSRFIPGTLASLPSESLLGEYLALGSSFGNSDATVGVENAISVDNKVSSLVPSSGGSNSEGKEHDAQIMDAQMSGKGHVRKAVRDAFGVIADDLVPERNPAKKINSTPFSVADNKGSCKPASETDGNGSSESFTPSFQKRQPGRPRKTETPSPGSISYREESTGCRTVTPGAIREVGSSHSSYGRITKLPTKNRRQVASKRVASSTSKSRIPQKASLSASSLPFNLDSGTTYTRHKEETTKTDKRGREKEKAFNIALYGNIPPIPELPRIDGLYKAAPVNNHKEEFGRVITIDNKVDSDETGGQATVMTVRKDGTKNKQGFEWPADVF